MTTSEIAEASSTCTGTASEEESAESGTFNDAMLQLDKTFQDCGYDQLNCS